MWRAINIKQVVMVLAMVFCGSCSSITYPSNLTTNEGSASGTPTIAPIGEANPTALPIMPQSVTKTSFPTPVYIPRDTETPSYTDTPSVVPTPDPPGTYSLTFYRPLILSYDSNSWSRSDNLKNRSLSTCDITEVGPVDFNQAPPVETVKLGNITYQILPFLDYNDNMVIAFFIDKESLPEYNYENALPLIRVKAHVTEWMSCKIDAEKVLSTLRVPK